MQRRTGSVLLLTLAAGLMLSTLGLLFSYYFARNAQRESDYLAGTQLRSVVYGEMVKMMESDPADEVMETVQAGVVYPGNQLLTVTKQALFSPEKNFRVCRVGAQAGNREFFMANHSFIPTVKVQERAANEVFTASSAFTSSTLNYMGNAPHSSGISFTVPQELQDYCWKIDSGIMDEFKRIGFGKKIYYFKGDINFPSATYLGDGMFVVGGNLTLAARSVFQGRTVFFVKGSTTLNSNVVMRDVLIMSKGSVRIYSGCDLTGHFRTNMALSITGKGNFTVKNDAGRPFHSVAYVWD